MTIRHYIFLFTLSLFVQFSTAQIKELPVSRESIQESGLKKHLSVLASPEMEGRKAGTYGARMAADYILTEFRKLGLIAPDSIQQSFLHYADTVVFDTIAKRKKLKIKQRKERVTARSANVIGYIPGNKYPDEFVILSAHYDHMGKEKNKIFFGADDNASGTSALINIAEAFANDAAAGSPPDRTVVFIAFGAEEAGLLGSQLYVRKPVFPLHKTSANINMDMVGREKEKTAKSADESSMFVLGGDRLSGDWQPVLNKVQEKTGLQLDETYGIKFDPEMLFLRSDQYHFATNGVPALFFTNGLHADYHLPSDVEAKIKYTAMAKRANFIFQLAREVANREEMLKRGGKGN